MARINLLPWREWERRRNRQRFLAVLAFSFVLGIVGVIVASQVVAARVEKQQVLNIYLKQQIVKLNRDIYTIHNLKKTRESLLARMHVIERLQRSRPLVVHLFDRLVRTLPNNVYLTKVVNRSSRLTIQGIADSPAGVSNYMRNIAASAWLGPPNLEVVRTTVKAGRQRSHFTVTTKLQPPQEQQDGSGFGGARS